MTQYRLVFLLSLKKILNQKGLLNFIKIGLSVDLLAHQYGEASPHVVVLRDIFALTVLSLLIYGEVFAAVGSGHSGDTACALIKTF